MIPQKCTQAPQVKVGYEEHGMTTSKFLTVWVHTLKCFLIISEGMGTKHNEAMHSFQSWFPIHKRAQTANPVFFLFDITY